MPMLFELKQQHHAAAAKAETLINAAETAGRPLTPSELLDVEAATAELQALAPQIRTVEAQNTLRGQFGLRGPLSEPIGKGGSKAGQPKNKALGKDYADSFHAWLSSGGQQMNSALYEGSNVAGGFAVPVEVAGEIVPLAPPEMSIRKLATIIPTLSDIRIPRKATFSVAAGKLESGATLNSFEESSPTLDQITLSAFMAGILMKLSWEVVQDVNSFQSWAINDMLTAQQTYEESLYISGTGNAQAQGLIGNVGTGVTESPDANGNIVSLDGILDLVGSLNAVYHENASFLMARPTSIGIRKAQRQSNLFEPAFTRSNGQDYLYGYPVAYSAAMPATLPGACPVLFGDFKQGYIIGDRGGDGINVKLLDQPWAPQGQVGLICFRRMDGRVRRSEAIQSYNIHA